MALMLIIFSVSMYYTSANALTKAQRESNEKILAQINYNISTMNEIVSTMANNMFLSQELLPLMVHTEPDMIDTIRIYDRLKSTLASNAFLHSIVIYNGDSGKLYSQGKVSFEDPDSEAAKQIHRYLSEGQVVRNKLTPMSLQGDSEQIEVFSYVMYDSFLPYDPKESAVIVNVDPEWLFDNLKVVNELATDSASQIFLANNELNLFAFNHEPIVSGDEIKQALKQPVGQSASPGGFVVHPVGGEQAIISYTQTDISDLYVVTAQPYSVVLGNVAQMRTVSLAVTGIFIALSVLVSLWLSHRLYQPVEKLFRQVVRTRHDRSEMNGKAMDELSYMSSVYKQINDHLELAQQEKRNKGDILRSYFLRRWISQSQEITPGDWSETIADNRLNVRANGGYLLYLITIDEHYLASISNEGKYSIELYLFAIMNIAKELIGRSRPCEPVNMMNHELVLLISLGDAEVRESAELVAIEELQAIIKQYYQLPIHVTVSDRIEKPQQITEQYERCLQYAKYRIVTGGSIITPEMVKDNLTNAEYHLPLELEKKLVEGMKASNLNQLELVVDKLMEHISKLNYDYIKYSLMQIVILMKTTLKEMNENRLDKINIDMNVISDQVMAMRSLEQAGSLFTAFFIDFVQSQKRDKEERNDILADTIKEYIKENYMDTELSLQGISSMLKMSPNYVGQLFKKSESISVADYLNEIRLYHAQQLLTHKSYSVNEVMERVGYANQSYFFRLFKKKFGTTPKSYRLNKSIE